MKFEYSLIFQNQLHHQFRYLTKHSGQRTAQKILDGFICGFENRVSDHPGSAPLCIEAAEIGLTSYHDYIDKKCQLRTTYRFSKTESTVYPLLLLNTKQSIRQALIQYCLSH